MAAELEQHLAGCQVCRMSADALARDKTMVRGLLSSLGGTGPLTGVEGVLARGRRVRSRRWALLAAVILLGMVTVAGATIATGWFQAVVERMRGPQPETPPETPAIQSDAPLPAGIAVEAGESVEIVFQSRQGTGRLTITESDGASVEIITTASVPYTVRNGKVTINNERTKADYRITIPRRLLRAEVRVADQVVFTKRGSGITATVEVDSSGSYRVPFP